MKIVYRSDMPDTLPTTLFIKQLYKKLVFLFCTAIRAIIVSSVWLILLPYLTVWTWRFYLWSGENLAYRLSRLQNINITTTITASSSLLASSASSSSIVSSIATTTPSPIASSSFSSSLDDSSQNSYNIHFITSVFPHSIHIEKMLKSFNTKAFFADCFEGQIITCIVVIAFVAAFLLREWIIQNIPAELEDEDDEERVVVIEDEDENEIMDETTHLVDETDQQTHLEDDVITHYGNNGGLDRRREAIYELHQHNEYNPTDSQQPQPHHDQEQQPQEQQQPSMTNVNVSYPKPSSSVASTSTVSSGTQSMGDDEDDHDYSPSSEDDEEDDEEEEEGDDTSDTEDMIPMAARGEPPNAPIMRHVDHHFDLRGQRRAILFEEQANDHEMMLPPAAPLHEQNPVHHHHHQPQLQLQQPINELNNPLVLDNEENDMEDENFGEDIDGILEAIGMRGNYWMLAQNSALMSLLISICLGVAVWMPYVTGIMFIMESPFQAVGTLLWIVRKITDPLLDTLFLICTVYIWPLVPRIITPSIHGVQGLYRSLIPMETIHWIKDTTIEWTTDLYNYIDQQIYPVSSMPTSFFSSPPPPPSPSPSPNAYSTVINNWFSKTSSSSSSTSMTTTTMSFTDWNDTQITLSNLMEQIKPALRYRLERYHSIAIGQTALDRFICITIGYAVIIAVSYWYLARTHAAYATFGRSARQVIRQQGIILKVAMFIAIELLLFPFVCGILLDMSSLSLFKDGTIDSRISYLYSHPLASVFLHWFLGTAFMFFFAILVAVGREIVRPGVLWFIRDPNDPQFHPIKEIVERPVLTQLQKIGASGITYACVIVAGVGGVVWCLSVAGNNILPLRWNMLQPLSTLPIDFLIVHIAIPAMVKYFEPKRVLKNLAIQWMRFLCRKLRLTSFMFGERHAAEEGVWHYFSWFSWFYPSHHRLNPLMGEYPGIATFVYDGQVVLAPKHDAVPFDPTRRMLVPVHPETLQILDENERRLGHPAAPRPPGGTSDDVLTANTCVVYIPPRFKQRMILFLLALWSSSSVFVCTMTILPIALGRTVYQQWLDTPGEVHDLYAYFVGSTLMLFGIVLLYKSVDAVMDISHQASMSAFIRRAYFYVSDALYLLGKATYLIVTLGVILPLMIGLMVELYVIMPLQDYGLKPPTIEILSMWTRGIACMSTFHGIIHLGPENPIRGHVNLIFQHTLRTIHLREITYKIILPAIGSTLIMTVFPFLMALANIKLFDEKDLARQIRLIQVMYPAALVGVGVYYLCRIGAKFGQNWVQTVREDNYLVGRVLHNFDNHHHPRQHNN
ncbi:hypothetical protein BDA99DRAFT_540018 [Phascolomyces articulosus]|uniref:RING-type E3 ubiquitin transferase n=1 Tax=Phascolomyces articulosus TaxID=60185 RepID=A0AAD5JUG5_9FUNG|nr:hypothetical protein BDA99DRAFT_540018 [Phascolomyces articulosus]